MAQLAIALVVFTVTLLLLYRIPLFRQILPPWLGDSNQRKRVSGKPGSEAYRGQQNGHAKPFIHVISDRKMADEGGLSEGERTPTATATKGSSEIPVFSLSGDSSDEKANEKPHTTTTTSASKFPAATSVQRVSSLSSPTKPPSSNPQSNSTGLMPPPARPIPKPPSAIPSNLRVPTTGPLPNRGPPVHSQQRVSSSNNNTLSANGTAKSTPNPRSKVQLAPGHSPMDWAALTRNPASNLSGVPTLQRVTPSVLKTQTGRKGKPAWSSWQGKVYNLTPYIPFHPGGEAEIMKAAGRDGTALFMDVHPWVNWENMLGGCLVGVLVPEGQGDGSEGDLEGLD